MSHSTSAWIGCGALILLLFGCESNGEPSSSGSGAAAGSTAGNGGESGSSMGGAAGASASGGGGSAATGNIARIDGGRYHTCISMRSGAVYCWGQGAYGALGNNGSYKGVPTKALVIDDALDVHCGGRFSCARRAAKSLFCWGEDQAGQLGGPDTKPCGDAQIDSVCAPVPQVVSGIDGAAGIALGRDHACALLGDGSVACWGENADGQLGNSTLSPQMSPAAVAGIQGATQITAGDAHTCALVGSPGKVACWGHNQDGQVGSGAVTDRAITRARGARAGRSLAGGTTARGRSGMGRQSIVWSRWTSFRSSMLRMSRPGPGIPAPSWRAVR